MKRKLLLAGFLVVVGATAWALNAGTGITFQNGTVSLVIPVVVSSGGTGATSLGAHGVVVGEGTSSLVSVGGTGGVCSTGQVLTCNSNGTADPSFQATSAAVFPTVTFGGGMDITTSQTVFLGPGTGGMDTTEGFVQAVSPAATFSNLRCNNAAIQGTSNNITITARSGACSGALSDSTMTCTITGTTGAGVGCSDVSHTVAPTVGQCWDIKVVTPGTLTANAHVSCVVERTT